MTAIVDPEICIGCTLCTQVCPEVFLMDIDKAVVYLDPVSGEFQQRCRDAAKRCPVNAISIKK